MKSSITQTTVQLNDQTINTVSTLEPYTLYVNPYYVITAFSNADRKSKHYYMGTQRVATDLGVEYWASPTPQESTGGRDNTTKVGTTSSGTSSPEQSLGYLDDLQRVLEQLSEGLEVGDVTMTSTPIESFYPELVQESAAAETAESETPLYSGSRILYWYHPDYVSNVDLVTDRTGEAYELFLYNAWGESLHHWTSSSSNAWSSPYRFNSKELDPETGMHYYGARYHHPKLSVWMSVDPLAQQTLEAYQFTGNNPIGLIDENGLWTQDPDGNWIAEKGDSWWTFHKEAGLTWNETINFAKDYNQNKGRSNWKTVREFDVVTLRSIQDKTNNSTVVFPSEIIDEKNVVHSTSFAIPLPEGVLSPGASVSIPGTIAFAESLTLAAKRLLGIVSAAFLLTGDTRQADFYQEHSKGARPSTKGKHEKGNSRKNQDRQGSKGETKPPRKRPENHSGPWPPKKK
jgi:RHS repeat-associated protein